MYNTIISFLNLNLFSFWVIFHFEAKLYFLVKKNRIYVFTRILSFVQIIGNLKQQLTTSTYFILRGKLLLVRSQKDGQ